MTVESASITALPNGSSEIVTTFTDHVVGIDVRQADGSWPSSGWGQLYERGGHNWASDVSVAGLPNGTIQTIEIAHT